MPKSPKLIPLRPKKQKTEKEEVVITKHPELTAKLKPLDTYNIVDVPRWIPPSIMKATLLKQEEAALIEQQEKSDEFEFEDDIDELEPPVKAETDLTKISMKYVIGWQYYVFEFGIMLFEFDKESDGDFGNVMDLRRWYQGPRQTQESLEEWCMSCFVNRFAIERAWEHLYQTQPTMYVSAFQIICGQGKETRQKFAEFVHETIKLRQLVRIASGHSKIRMPAKDTYIMAKHLLERISVQWFRSRNNTVDMIGMYAYQECTPQMFELLNECDIEDFDRVDGEEKEKETMRQWMYRSVEEWMACGDTRTINSEGRRMRIKESVDDAVSTVGQWINWASNASQRNQILVLIVVLVVSIIVKDDIAGRKKVVWLCSLLKMDIENSTHILKTTASLCFRRSQKNKDRV